MINKINNNMLEQNELVDKFFNNFQSAPEPMNFLHDLTEECKNKVFVNSREKEFRKILEILSRKEKSNPILIGESGVGKTTLVEQLANKIANNNISDFLIGYKIYRLSIQNLIANTNLRGMYEEKIAILKDFFANNKKSILFIDEIQTAVNYDKTFDQSNDLLSILKPELSRGEIKLIGTSTSKDFMLNIENIPGLSRRLEIVYIPETSLKETARILLFVKSDLEKFHNVKISDEAIKVCLFYCQKFILNKYFPDKAIDILDLACSKIKINQQSKIKELENIKKEIDELKTIAFLENNYKKSSKIKQDKLTILQKKEETTQTDLYTEIDILQQIKEVQIKLSETKEQIIELRKYFKLNEATFLENVTIIEFENKLINLFKKMKNINPNFQAHVTEFDIFQTLGEKGILNEKMIDKNFFDNLLEKMKLNILFGEKEIKKIIISLKNKFKSNPLDSIQLNKVFGFFAIISEDFSLTKTILFDLNKEINGIQTSITYLEEKDFLNKPITFWQEKISSGCKMFAVNLEHNFPNEFFNNIIVPIIKNGIITNERDNICSVANCIFILIIKENINYSSEKEKDSLILNTLYKQIGKESYDILNEVIFIEEMNRMEKIIFARNFITNSFILKNKISNILFKDNWKKSIVNKEDYQQIMLLVHETIIKISEIKEKIKGFLSIDFDIQQNIVTLDIKE